MWVSLWVVVCVSVMCALPVVRKPPPSGVWWGPSTHTPTVAGMTELQHEQLCAEHADVAAQQWDRYEAWLRSQGYPVPESRADN